MTELTGRVAFVTGASSGIGKACAFALCSRGCKVILASRSAKSLATVVSDLSVIGEVTTVLIDMANPLSIKAAASKVHSLVSQVDILVNNAGIRLDGLMISLERSNWDKVLATNLTGPLLLTREVLPSMSEARWGRIINISSTFGQIGNLGQANYATSKAALIGVTRALARQVGCLGITVNAVAPGFISTPMTAGLTDLQRNFILGRVPLRRAGSVDDVASAVAFLASDSASYITGHVLDVNGGMYMGG